MRLRIRRTTTTSTCRATSTAPKPEDLQDIDAHLKGGIPNRDIDGLAPYWQVFPSVRGELFRDADRPGYCQPKVEASQVKAAIFGHPEFTAFNQRVTKLFAEWKAANTPLLTGIKQGDRPKVLIETLSENLLETFRKAPLIDPYDVYQHLMDYWAETMQDDAWIIASEGWEAAKVVRQLFPTKDKNEQGRLSRRS